MTRNALDEIVKQAFMTPPCVAPVCPQSSTSPLRKAMDLTPKQVIFNPPATIVYWPDGDKTVVRCDNDEFSEEFGYAMACMRKIYGTRAEFKAQFKNAIRPQQKPIKAKKPKAVGTKVVALSGTGAPSLNQLLKDLAGDDSIGVQIAFRTKDV